MTSFPGSPRLLKGALVALDPFNPLASVIAFQYNPAQLTRTLAARGPREGGDRGEAMRLAGAPTETFKLDVEIDATDQLERGEARDVGIHPQLAALEMLLYPKSAVVVANTVLSAAGSIEVIAPEAPLTVLVWGKRRVMPVRITGFTVTEDEYDERLNPIRAKVSLDLQVLTYSDLSISNPGYHLYLAHQVAKEAMAVAGSVSSASALVPGAA
jgi:hypothetical protein